jgi:hypothetical protein
MSTTISKPKAKRLPKGQRTHVRRMKQEAHNAGVVKKPVSQSS